MAGNAGGVPAVDYTLDAANPLGERTVYRQLRGAGPYGRAARGHGLDALSACCLPADFRCYFGGNCGRSLCVARRTGSPTVNVDRVLQAMDPPRLVVWRLRLRITPCVRFPACRGVATSGTCGGWADCRDC